MSLHLASIVSAGNAPVMQNGIRFFWLLCLVGTIAAAVFAQPTTGDNNTSVKGARICYIKSQALWIAKEDGGDARTLIPEGSMSYPRISPDGATVAYTFDASNENSLARQIWLLDVASKKTARLKGLPGDNNYFPVWSPDGKWIMLLHLEKKKWHTVIVGRDGQQYRNLTKTLDGTEDSVYPAWWATDSQSVHAYDFNFVYQIAIDGKELARKPIRNLLSDAELSSGYVFSLSPNGKQLVFDVLKEVPDIQPEEGIPGILYLTDASLKNPPSRVSPKGVQGATPVWSSDGKTVLFQGSTETMNGIYRLLPEFSEAKLFIPEAGSVSVSRAVPE